MSLERSWYAGAWWLKLFRPLSALFRFLAARQRLARTAQQWHAPVPVIVVGNITLGGSGKTPVTLALIEMLRARGYKPGVVSRGYGGKPPKYPFAVTVDTSPAQGGDEPCLIVQRTGVPLVIDPDRPAAVRALLEESDCNIVISDDGLQHYALGRDLELAVVDARRGLGNGRCVPEGPLREPPERLAQVDRVILNGVGAFSFAGASHMQLVPGKLVELTTERELGSDQWTGSHRVHALAGIGHPARFFDTLRTLGFDPIEHPLRDHASIEPEQLRFEPELPLIMTEKDAVKCRGWSPAHCWALRVDARFDAGFEPWLDLQLNRLQQRYGSP
ncbi:tetraacyldisaccharide 4'-kinase [Marinobacterium zhoushanense]|uniref:Tetraacyldisaccharide 4'-kinase n=1 Tax=Marinobacterium zhoushanense TaxID=1679163 RepID=A0ABQ1KN45_9GAMM|nr:tetraacyldisaccharide 4'-kinase [Marinobacterium zhoushanense]GGC02985.1 tetraacyldisaccharide 4'-kinase [Marinobacterium zhoushanense]